MHVDLPPVAVNIQFRLLLNTARYVAYIWEYAEYHVADHVVDMDTTRCLDIDGLSARMNHTWDMMIYLQTYANKKIIIIN